LTFAERHAQRAGAIQLTNLTPGIPVKVTIRPSGLGDHIENLVKPIAKALNWPCNDAAGRLKPESRCAKLRDALNRAVPLG